jgi:hypothetical protein
LTTKAVVPPQDIEAIRQKLTPVTVTSPAPEPAPAPEQVAVLPATEAPLATPNQAPAAQIPQAQPNPQSIPAMCIIPKDKPLIDATTALPDQNFAFLNLVAEGRLGLGAGTWNPEVAGVWLGAEKSDFSLLIPTDNRKASLSITLAAFKFATFPVKIQKFPLSLMQAALKKGKRCGFRSYCPKKSPSARRFLNQTATRAFCGRCCRMCNLFGVRKSKRRL